MTKKEIDQEFKNTTLELHKGLPSDKPFPPDVVRRRELLLFAQVHLIKILDAKHNKDRLAEIVHLGLYNVFKFHYYNMKIERIN